MDKIPYYVALKPDSIRFVQVDGEWFIVGKLDSLPIDKMVEVEKYSTKDIIEVKVLEHLMSRRVKHRGDSEFTEYILARFE